MPDRVGEGAVRARLGQREADLGAQQGVRYLDQDARAVTAGRLGSGGTPVLQVGQRGERVHDDRMTSSTMGVGHHGDTTCIVFGCWVVKTLRARLSRENHREYLPRRW
jgi:hypothetical protein